MVAPEPEGFGLNTLKRPYILSSFTLYLLHKIQITHSCCQSDPAYLTSQHTG